MLACHQTGSMSSKRSLRTFVERFRKWGHTTSGCSWARQESGRPPGAQHFALGALATAGCRTRVSMDRQHTWSFLAKRVRAKNCLLVPCVPLFSFHCRSPCLYAILSHSPPPLSLYGSVSLHPSPFLSHTPPPPLSPSAFLTKPPLSLSFPLRIPQYLIHWIKAPRGIVSGTQCTQLNRFVLVIILFLSLLPSFLSFFCQRLFGNTHN